MVAGWIAKNLVMIIVKVTYLLMIMGEKNLRNMIADVHIIMTKLYSVVKSIIDKEC